MDDHPPPESANDRFAASPKFLPTSELLFRFKRLVIAMTIAAVVLAILPLPAVVYVIVLMALPLLVLVVSISRHDFERNRFVYRYTRKLWEFRRDRAYLDEAGERAENPVQEGLRRAWLLLGLFVAVFAIGLVLAGLSSGVSDRLYG